MSIGLKKVTELKTKCDKYKKEKILLKVITINPKNCALEQSHVLWCDSS